MPSTCSTGIEAMPSQRLPGSPRFSRGRLTALALAAATPLAHAGEPATNDLLARSWGVALNWYLTRNLKLAANYTGTVFDGGAAGGGDRPDERVFFTRAQLSF
jgi:hypothetical protein